MTTGNRRLVGLALLGLALVVGGRWALPQAPPMYDGVPPTQPYRYCHPAANLKSSNTLPSGGAGDLQVVNRVNKLGTVETRDGQVVVFFAQGVFRISSPIHVTINPICSSPPAPPPKSTLIGNVYSIQVSSGGPSASTPPSQIPVQVLLRVPPVAYNTVRVFYAGIWRDTQFSAQLDLVNVSVTSLGEVAAFNDTRLQRQAKPPPTVSYATIVSVVLLVIAVLLIGAGILAQRQRMRGL